MLICIASSTVVESEDIDILQVEQINDNATSGTEFSCKERNLLPSIPIASDLTTPDLLQSDLHSSSPPTSTTISSTSSSSITQRDPTDLLWWREGINLDKANLTLMGFSKGCVVLNQVRNCEFVYTSKSD